MLDRATPPERQALLYQIIYFFLSGIENPIKLKIFDKKLSSMSFSLIDINFKKTFVVSDVEQPE